MSGAPSPEADPADHAEARRGGASMSGTGLGGASAAAIRHHYDVGNDFYRLWLDPSMTYSCALWEEGDTLESAQVRKLDFHAAQARAAGAARVLDVGCGWGSGLRRLVEHHGVGRAVGLTLSAAQAEWVRALGVPGIEARVEGWEEHAPEAPYDAVISIGAFEHFARPQMENIERVAAYRAFFARCHGWLRPAGWMSLQTIAWGNARPEDRSEFFTREIFPESDLPKLADVAAAADRLFEVVALRNDRRDYARTAREWLARLAARRAEAVATVGEEAVLRFERYLKLVVVAFEALGNLVLYRISLRRIDRPRA